MQLVSICSKTPKIKPIQTQPSSQKQPKTNKPTKPHKKSLEQNTKQKSKQYIFTFSNIASFKIGKIYF